MMTSIIFAIYFLLATFFVALLASFVVLLMHKWGIVEYMQINANDFFSKMFHCDFCLCWWASVCFSLFAALLVVEWEFLYIPFFSTVIARKLL